MRRLAGGSRPGDRRRGGVRTADAFGPVSPQKLEEGTFPVPTAWVAPFGQPQAEDCLSLNVFTPGTGGSRPVMVWVHGGAFLAGASSAPLCDGSRLARTGDVVVVTVNFRLGALGLLAHPDLANEDGPAGNWALLDLLEALRWVHDNAAAFGGTQGT